MESFKVTLDRIEEGIAVLLIRDEEKIKINIPVFLLPEGTKEEIFWTLKLPKMYRKQTLQKKESLPCLKNLRTKIKTNEMNVGGERSPPLLEV